MGIYGLDWDKGETNFSEDEYKCIFPEISKIIPVKKEEDLSEEDYNIIFTETSKIISEKKDKNIIIAMAFCFRGKVYSFWGKNQQAITDYSSAIELDNKFLSAFYHRGRLYALDRQYDNALSDLNKALQISPDDQNVIKLIGHVQKAKQIKEANEN